LKIVIGLGRLCAQAPDGPANYPHEPFVSIGILVVHGFILEVSALS
jgi:hypothetical protein